MLEQSLKKLKLCLGYNFTGGMSENTKGHQFGHITNRTKNKRA